MAWHRPSQVDPPQSLNHSSFMADLSHRMDKFYMLIRRFVNASFILLIENGWSPSLFEEHNTILLSAGGPLWCVGTPS